MVSREIVGIHLERTPEHALRVTEITFLQVDLSQRDKRPAKKRIQPDRLLKRRDGFVPFECSRVRFAEHIVSHRETGIDCDLLPQELDAFVELSAIDRDLAE